MRRIGSKRMHCGSEGVVNRISSNSHPPGEFIGIKNVLDAEFQSGSRENRKLLQEDRILSRIGIHRTLLDHWRHWNKMLTFRLLWEQSAGSSQIDRKSFHRMRSSDGDCSDPPTSVWGDENKYRLVDPLNGRDPGMARRSLAGEPGRQPITAKRRSHVGFNGARRLVICEPNEIASSAISCVGSAPFVVISSDDLTIYKNPSNISQRIIRESQEILPRLASLAVEVVVFICPEWLIRPPLLPTNTLHTHTHWRYTHTWGCNCLISCAFCLKKTHSNINYPSYVMGENRSSRYFTNNCCKRFH